MKTKVFIIKAIATLDCKPRRLLKSITRRGMLTNDASLCRNTVRNVAKVIGPLTIDIVTYLAKTCHEIKANRPCPPRPTTFPFVSTFAPLQYRVLKPIRKTHNIPNHIHSLRLTKL